MASFKLVIGLILSALVCVLGYIYVRPAPPPGVNYSILGDIAYARVAILYCSMLLGIFAQAVHDEIHRQRRSKSHLSVVRQAIKSHGLLAAITISPIIFFSTYQAAGEQPDGVVAFCLAFQNGFFWKAVFTGVERSMRSSQEG